MNSEYRRESSGHIIMLLILYEFEESLMMRRHTIQLDFCLDKQDSLLEFSRATQHYVFIYEFDLNNQHFYFFRSTIVKMQIQCIRTEVTT